MGIEVGHELIVITWLHEAKRDVLKGHPRNGCEPSAYPLGLHPVTVREIDGTHVKIGPVGRLSRLLHRHDTSGANFPLRVRHPRPVARAPST